MNTKSQSTRIITKTESFAEDRTCIKCGKPAICTEKGCWKLKEGTADCTNCAERYCTKHWRHKVTRL